MELITTEDYRNLAAQLKREGNVVVAMDYGDFTMTVGSKLDQNDCLWINVVRPYRREWCQFDMRREEVEAMIGAAVTALNAAKEE